MIRKLIKKIKDNLLSIIIITFVFDTLCDVFDIQLPPELGIIWSIALLWLCISGIIKLVMRNK